MNKYYYAYQVDSYYFYITQENEYITRISLFNDFSEYQYKETELIKKTKEELAQYFQNKRKTFDIPIKLTGTIFQNKVWEEMKNIPFGKTLTYQELAKKCGNEKAWRAIGNACHHNPLLIVVPCHRVIGSKGLGGFVGGVDMKIKLLEMEGGLH